MRQWAIAIGINQYQFFQPLIYAQADAQAVRTTLSGQAGFTAEQCLLLTDTSPPLLNRSTSPDREAILGWLDWLYQHSLKPGDRLWFFFSGYGVCHQGQDYLVPLDGNPAAVTTTGIPISQLFQRFQSAPIDTVLILDVSRSQGSLSSEMVGAHTAQLAAMAGVPTLLSCEPGQFSHETVALGHGFFTAALLDTLHQRTNLTLAGLEQRLRDRVPQLTEQYYRPPQLPLLICPPAKREQVILEAVPVAGTVGQRASHPAQGTVGGNGTGRETGLMTPLVVQQANGYRGNGRHPGDNGQANGNGQGQVAIAMMTPPGANGGASVNGAGVTTASPVALSTPATLGDGTSMQHSTNGHNSPPMANHSSPTDASNHPPTPPNPVPSPVTTPGQPSDPSDPNDSPTGGLLLWGGIVATALLLAAGVYWRNFAALTGRSVVAPSPVSDRGTADSIPPTKIATTSSTTVKGGGSGNLGGASNAISPSPVVNPPVPQPVPPQVVNPKPTEPKVVNPKPATVKPVNAGKPTAIAGTRQTGSVPVNAKSASKPANSKSGSKSGQTVSSPKPVRSVTRSRKEIYSNQASPYWYGIQEARKVKPTDPDYRQAQQDIARWSREIWAIAQWRAGQRRYDVAIMAASLVPGDQAIHKEAQQAIDRWCPGLSRYRVVNADQRRQARAICQRE